MPMPTPRYPPLSLGTSRPKLTCACEKQNGHLVQCVLSHMLLLSFRPPRWPSGKASASRTEDPGFESRLRRKFFGVESYQWLKNWHSSGYPARRLALLGQHWDWSARCQYTVTGWGRTFDLQLLSQCGSTYNCLSRSVPEIHSSVAGTLNNKQIAVVSVFDSSPSGSHCHLTVSGCKQ